MSKGKNDCLSLLGGFFLKIYLWKLLTMWKYFFDLINVHGVIRNFCNIICLLYWMKTRNYTFLWGMSILHKELRRKFWGFIEAIVNLWINVLLKIKFFWFVIRTCEHIYTVIPFIKCLVWFLRLKNKLE